MLNRSKPHFGLEVEGHLDVVVTLLLELEAVVAYTLGEVVVLVLLEVVPPALNKVVSSMLVLKGTIIEGDTPPITGVSASRHLETMTERCRKKIFILGAFMNLQSDAPPTANDFVRTGPPLSSLSRNFPNNGKLHFMQKKATMAWL